MRFLITTHADPRFMPRTFIDPDEIVAGPYYNNVKKDGRIRFMGTPGGEILFKDTWDRIPEGQKPDVLLVHADVTCGCLPVGLPSGLPRFLLVGDTHHMDAPISKMLRYALQERFNAVFVWNRNVAHFFKEAGIPHVFWMPGLIMGVPPVPVQDKRRVELAFFGQAGKYHPRRIRLLDALKESGIPLFSRPMPRLMGLDRFAGSLMAFNASLNGEINMRIFEASSTGAMILTDRLSPQHGLEKFYKDGESMVTYGSEAELVEKARYYIQHPQEAMQIGLRGKEVYEKHFTTQARRDAFMAIVQGGAANPEFLLADEPRCRLKPAANEAELKALFTRIAFYEWLQERHRVDERLSVDVITAASAPLFVSDICDLYRLDIRLKGPALQMRKELEPVFKAFGAQVQCDSPELSGGTVLLADAQSLDEPAVMALVGKKYSAVFMARMDEASRPACDKVFADIGMVPSQKVPGLYENA